HVLERRALRRPLEVAVLAVAEPRHRRQRTSLRDFLDREVELVAGDELDRGRGAQRALALDGHVGADEADPQPRILPLERLGDAVEALERWWMQEQRPEVGDHSRLSYRIHPEGTAAAHPEEPGAG